MCVAETSVVTLDDQPRAHSPRSPGAGVRAVSARSERRERRVPAHARRPQGARPLRRPCRGGARLRPSALGRGADAAGALAVLPEQCGAARRAPARGDDARAILRPRPRYDLLRELRRGSERERAEAGLQDDRRHAGHRGRRQLPWSHGRRGRGHVGRARRSGIGFPAQAVRRDVHQAEATCDDLAHADQRQHRRRDRRAGARRRRRGRSCRRNSSRRCGFAAARTARFSSSTKCNAASGARATRSPRTCTASRPTSSRPPRRSAQASRCPQCSIADHVAAYLKTDTLGTTFGGGPMACAIVETVIDIIESENLLDERASSAPRRFARRASSAPSSARRAPACCSACARSRPAKDVQAELLKLDILTGTSADPNVCASSRRSCCEQSST